MGSYWRAFSRGVGDLFKRLVHREGHGESKNAWAETSGEAISVVQQKGEGNLDSLMTMKVKSRHTS